MSVKIDPQITHLKAQRVRCDSDEHNDPGRTANQMKERWRPVRWTNRRAKARRNEFGEEIAETEN